MALFFLLPLLLLKYYFFEVPYRVARFYLSLDVYLLNFFSVPVLFSTFFKPLKNEYRGDLVVFSIGMGMVVKSVLLFASTIILLCIVVFEAVSYVLLFAGPVYILLQLYF